MSFTSASLSFSAEQLLGVLERRVVGEATPGGWLVAFVEQDRQLAEATAPSGDLDILLSVARRESEEEAVSLTRADVAQRATRRAAEAGREVAGTSDVAAVVLAAVALPWPRQEPDPGEAEGEPAGAAKEAEPPASPLSFAAERLLQSLVTGATGLHELLVALADHHADAIRAADIEVDATAVAAEARRRVEGGESGEQWDADRLLAEAAVRAGAAGREVTMPSDLVEVLLAAGAELAAVGLDAVELPAQIPVREALRAAVGANEATKPSERVVRVFVSSTFRDMAAERDELVKRVFPQLRKLCDERGVTWGEVDLRWGITDEQRAEGDVLPVCLAEIARCRPYFIGLLGERYGWVPDEIPPGLVEEEPWLEEHLGRSVTELEILHGVLRNPDMKEHAFFYLRDPAYVATLPEGQRDEYRDDSTEMAGKLEVLKERIRESGFPVRERYPDPQALGRLVLEDLTGVIDELFPPDSVPDPLDREAAEHEMFARSRAGVYVRRRGYLDRLNALAEGEGPPLVLVGESGSGKSALLANWAIVWRDSHPDDLVVMHFIGGTPHSGDWAAMLRRVMGELARRFEIDEEIPDQPDALRRVSRTSCTWRLPGVG